MADLIFSTLVGIGTYSFLSWLIYQPKPKATTTTTKTVAVAPTLINSPVIDEEVEIDLWDTTSESEVAIAIAIDEPVETIEADETAEIDETIAEIETTKIDETIKADETAEIDEHTLSLVDNEADIKLDIRKTRQNECRNYTLSRETNFKRN